MIVVRDVFRVQFGQMKPAVASLQDMASNLASKGETFPFRVLTDAAGPYYTLVLELTFDSLAAYESEMKTLFATEDWQQWYKSFLPFLTDGQREIYNIVETD
ncbi:hypothetical protein KQI65_10020 [bacterium]|nr:hypothetical protein [bacterium]